MRTARRIFAISMLLAVMISTTVYGAYSGTKNVRGTNYTEKLEGSKSIFLAVGNMSAYTTLTNKSTSTLYLVASVREYVYDSGWGTPKTKSANTAAGKQIVTDSITRNKNSYIRYYWHTGDCYANISQAGHSDSYTFKGNQYY